uniref:Alpha-1,6-mannosyl-glycoprotein 6-beta-N-acetylglucosaminyltransferase n=1 Tax=Angiostrongylus cantonensis TaxID=6313 RepID=A0A0K0CU92_ANGCA
MHVKRRSCTKHLKKWYYFVYFLLFMVGSNVTFFYFEYSDRFACHSSGLLYGSCFQSRLKAMLTEHSNDSSFLIPYCGGLPPMCYDSGAGEALCSLTEAQSDGINDRLCSINEVHEDNVSEGLSSQTEHTTTRESTVEQPINNEHQDDMQDEGYNEKMDEDGSVSSSDDETYRILERQLKKKGEVVRFQPPRVTVHPRHYKRFGKMERCALAEFDYLQDISTDVSALQSSPEGHHSVAI